MTVLASQTPSQIRVTCVSDAERLVAGILHIMTSLEAILTKETELMRKGRMKDALDFEPEKSALAGDYMRGLEALKANAIALARFTPESLQHLKDVHRSFSATLDTNHAVLATARAVSEGLMRSLSEDIGQKTRPQGYGPTSSLRSPQANASSPLVISKNL